MNDMSPVIVPKSDQYNAEDFLAGPRTFCIESVRIAPGEEQPVSISLVGETRVWRPCKSMSRCLVAVWGPDAKAYIGKSLTLYNDPKVKWGGMEVGGIRVANMSHIDGPITMVLAESKKSRKPFTVRPLAIAKPEKPPVQDKAAIGSAKLTERFNAAKTRAEYLAIVDDAEARKQLEWLQAKREDLYAGVAAAQRACLGAHRSGEDTSR